MNMTDAETMSLDPRKATLKKLTEWSKEPKLSDLKSDYDAAKPAHDIQMQKIQKWNDLMYVKNASKAVKIKGRSSVQPKLIRRQAEWRYAALTEPFLGSDKLFDVTPVTFEDAPAARQNELVLNWQFRTKLNRIKFIDDYVRSVVDEGTVLVRLGWKRTTTMLKEMVPAFEHYPLESEEQSTMLQEGLALKQENPRGFDESAPPELKAAVNYFEETGEGTYAVQVGDEETQVEKVLENFPTVEVMNPRNVVIDPSCNGCLDKAMFVVVSFETNKAELQKNKDRYKNLDAVDWASSSPIPESDHSTKTPTDFNLSDSARRKVVAFEYWGFYDVEGDGVLVPIVATWIGDVIVRMEENPFPDQKLPFVLVNYLPAKRELYGETDAELLEDNQNILGALSRGMLDLLGRSANSQQGTAKGMLDSLNKRRFDNGQDYEFNPNVSPNGGLIEHKYPEIPQTALALVSIQNNEAEALTGVKSFSGGVSGESYGRVAAGIRGALDAASKREMAILRRLAKGMTEIGVKIVAMNAQFMSDKEVIRITNKEFVEVLREDLAGNFDLVVDISTAEVDASKADDLAFMLQTMGNTMDTSITLMVLAEIARLKRMPELSQRISSFKPPEPTPEQLKMQELEMAKLEAEVEKIKSEANLNNAKAEEARANKDGKDLDYVEQETGTKHARDMEKQKAQSQGNQALEITKALVKPGKPDEAGPDIDAAIGFNHLSDKLNSAGQQAQPQSTVGRDEMVGDDPSLNLGSMYFDPSRDPAMNPNLSI